MPRAPKGLQCRARLGRDPADVRPASFAYAAPMNLPGLLRHGALDLISAAAFLAIWLLRDHFEYDTVRAFLFWPVVFEMYLALALFVAGMMAKVRSATVRWLWLGFCVAAYLFGAWLSGASADMPQMWTLAVWLLVARARPPRGTPIATPGYLQWLFLAAGHSGMLWGAGFIATMLLMLTIPGESVIQIDGSRVSTPPAWIFPLVWTPYFVAEALVRAWRETGAKPSRLRAPR
jgi:hypothetical protein